MTLLPNILIFIAAVLAVFGQSVFNGLRDLLGAQINLLPALMVYAALTASPAKMLSLAVTGGLLFDTLSANPLGTSVLPLLTVGVLIQWRRDLLLHDHAYAQFALGFVASAVVPLLSVLILLTLGKEPLLGWGSLWQWVVLSVGGGVAAPVLFFLFGWFNHALGYERVVESSFRPDREIQRGRN